MRQDAQTLIELPIFRGVPPAAIVDLTRRGVIESYEAHVRVFQQGEFSDRALLLISGRFEVTLGEGDALKRVGDVRPGEVVGETALFAPGRARSASVSTIEPSRALVLSGELLASSTSDPAVAAIERHLMGTMARRIRHTNLDLQRLWKDAPPPEEASLSLRERLNRFFSWGRS